ncbi:hypothetical protein [Aeoliella sp. SH292]|uniref:hypothetical protein n=1 Tax=Aeoliella sp. SH292 TaxID=3454464 RepID=UPI003F9E979F
MSRFGCGTSGWNVFFFSLLAVVSSVAPAIGASLGINFQTDRGGYGPASVAAETPASAFGVPAEHWFEPGAVQVGSGVHGSHGADVTIAWQSFPDGPPGVAYGWAHANQPGVPAGGDPASGEDAVLSGFLFATGPGEYASDAPAHPIIVTVSGLSGIADLTKGYTVRLMASSEWTVDSFTDAEVSDSQGNEEILSFTLMPETPLWWTGAPWQSSGALASSSLLMFDGDSVTIELHGFNELGSNSNRPYQRTSLAGVIIDFTPVPEPSAFAYLSLLAVTVLLAVRRTGSQMSC